MPKVVECEKCEFVSKTFVPTKGNPKGKLCIIAESPGKQEAKQGDNLVGWSGEFIFKALKKYNIERKDTFRFNVVKCFPDGDKLKIPTAKRCFKIFNYELDNFKGNKFLLVGNFATKIILGLELKEVKGKVVKKDGNYYGCIYHPAYYIRRYVEWVGGYPTDESKKRAYGEFLKNEGKVIRKLFESDSCNTDLEKEFNFKYTLVEDVDDMIKILERYKNKLVFFDLETKPLVNEPNRSALDWYYGKEYCDIICAGFAFFQNLKETTYKPDSFKLSYLPEKVVIYTGKWTKALAMAFSKCKIAAFNSTYDTGVIFKHTGIRLKIAHDPMDGAYLLNQSRKKYSLLSLAYEYVPEFASWEHGIKEETKKKHSIDHLSKEELYNYCAGDCVISSILLFKVLNEIKKKKLGFIYSVLMDVKNPLRDMEANGITINEKMYEKVKKEISSKLEALTNFMQTKTKEGIYYYKKHGKYINLNSNPQLMEVYQAMFPEIKFDGLGKEFLKEFAKEHNHLFSTLLLKYRKLAKEYNTYVKGLESKIKDNKVYASFRTITTRSGRTSSGGSDAVGLGKTNQINIQNIPRESTMRNLFRARDGYYLVSADYSQIEVRVAGAYARSPEILEACISGKDFHSYIASKAFNIPYEEVVEDDKKHKESGQGISYRQKAKSITFGILYGMTAVGLAKRLDLKLPNGELDIESAQKFIDDYFAGMKSIANWIEEVKEFVKKNLYVRTATGRIRWFQKLDDSVYRKAVNTQVQSTASDIFLMAINTIHEALQREGIKLKRDVYMPLYGTRIRFWGEVHDEIILEVHRSIPEDWIKNLVINCMTNKIKEKYSFVKEFMWKIPLESDVNISEVWTK